jgi:argininosuccinate synthase
LAKEKVVLAFSGGLDTSVCIRYLQMLHKVDVVTLTVDCGQNEDFEAVQLKAKGIGAL